MLEKTIKKVLKRKVEDWISTIDDENLVKVIKKDLVITGGCFTSFLQNEKPKDYDVYFRTKETVIAVAKYYVEKFNKKHGNEKVLHHKTFVLYKDIIKVDKNEYGQDVYTIEDEYFFKQLGISSHVVVDDFNDKDFKECRYLFNVSNGIDKDRVKIFIPSAGIKGQIEDNNLENMELGDDPLDIISQADEIPGEQLEEDTEKEKYLPVFLSANAITLSDGIQIVVRFYGEPKQIHDTYDFAHTKAYWCYHEDDVVISKEVYEAVINKTLIYTGSRYPVCSAIRMRKFIERGWKINAGQILKMAMQISDLDLTNINVLEDQLVGVDSTYFTQLISQFKRQQEKDNNWELDTGYIMSIIDKIF